jgi:hypothetical protein
MPVLKFIILFSIGILLSSCLYYVALYLFKIIALITLDRADMLFDLHRRNTINDSSLLLLHNMPIFFIFIFSFYWTYFISSQYQKFKELKYFDVDYKDGNKLNKKNFHGMVFYAPHDYFIILLEFCKVVFHAVNKRV